MLESTPDLAGLAAQVAALLGGGWTARPHRKWSGMQQLSHRDGRTVMLYRSSQGSRERLYACGELPDAPRDLTVDTTRIDAGEISMAPDKTAARVAADITRRLLPAVTEAHQVWHAKVARLRAHEDRRRTVAERLGAGPGMSQPRPAAHQHSDTWHLR
ncbi:hypothetical protein ACFV3E_40770 [Streptomyces sp. NPDC059718]